MNTNKTPSPERIYSTIVAILERRYNVRIEYTLSPKEMKGAQA